MRGINTMEITEIKLRKAFYGIPLEAIYSVTFDNELVVHDVKVVRRKEGLLVVMPNRRTSDGEIRDIVHPVNSAFRYKLDKQIVTYHNNLYGKRE